MLRLLLGAWLARLAALLTGDAVAAGTTMAALLTGAWAARVAAAAAVTMLVTGDWTAFPSSVALLPGAWAANPAVLFTDACIWAGMTYMVAGTGATTMGVSSALALSSPVFIASGAGSTITPLLPGAAGRTCGGGDTSFSPNIEALSQPSAPAEALARGTGSTMIVPFGLIACFFGNGTGSTMMLPLVLGPAASLTSAAAPLAGIGSTIMFSFPAVGSATLVD
mmetsp:Transcript_41603/g.75439  ORF Transcript_41603/g.75439 Transcript_41603/m.75439 type:complete len:223 (-) Transcript_41603:743-1411(-)